MHLIALILFAVFSLGSLAYGLSGRAKSSTVYLNSQMKKPKGCFVNTFSFEDYEGKEFIKIIPVGSFPHHHDGGHEITKEILQEMYDNFKATNTDLLVDYRHGSLWGDDVAAGWISELEVRDDGLYAKYPEFTPAAKEAIQNREYRYFSPVYWLNAQDKTGKSIGAKMHSVAILNTPYFDSEIDTIKNNNQNGEHEMKLTAEQKAKWIEKLGLAENVSDEELASAIDAALAESSDGGDEPEEQSDEGNANEGEISNSEVVRRLIAVEGKLTANSEETLKQNAKSLVYKAVEDFKIPARDTELWLNFAETKYDECKAKLDKIKVNSVKPSSLNPDSETSEGNGFDFSKRDEYKRNARKQIDATFSG